MRKSKFNQEQIINLLKSVEAGQKIADVCRSNSISEQTYHGWKAKCGGLAVNEVRRLKHLEQENRRLKQVVADLTLDNLALKDVSQKSGEACRTPPGSTFSSRGTQAVTAASGQADANRQLKLALQVKEAR
jgi:putative transposase